MQQTTFHVVRAYSEIIQRGAAVTGLVVLEVEAQDPNVEKIVVFCRDDSPQDSTYLELSRKRLVVTRKYSAFASYEQFVINPSGTYGAWETNAGSSVTMLAIQHEWPTDRVVQGRAPELEG